MKKAWAVRPYPHGIYRIKEFLNNGIAAIGWPDFGDLSDCKTWEQIVERLKAHNYEEGRSLSQVAGIISRFVNEIKEGDAIVVPAGKDIYFGVVTKEYFFKEHLVKDGYPHWIGVEYMFDGKPIPRSQLPQVIYDPLKCLQTVFALPGVDVWEVINNPKRFQPINVNNKVREDEQQVLNDYIKRLSTGRMPGINPTQFEEVVRKVLELYFPGLERLSTRNSPKGADTDLKAELPGNVTVRVQVKCYRDDWGKPLGEDAVKQLRGSMRPGDNGIIVTTGKASEEAKKLADSDPEKPIAIIEGPDFAQLVFDNIEKLSDQDLWELGLRCNRVLSVR